ncbi:unnamed protein product [Gordionus sp. m RMFG-2023]
MVQVQTWIDTTNVSSIDDSMAIKRLILKNVSHCANNTDTIFQKICNSIMEFEMYESTCNGEFSVMSIICNKRVNLSSVYANSTLKSMIINNHTFTGISSQEIYLASRLNYLKITRGTLKRIKRGTFNGSFIIILDLSQNIIESLDLYAFYNMTYLRILILKSNNISTLDISTFQFTNYVDYLDLGYNTISDLSIAEYMLQPFKRLKTLDLRKNKIYTFNTNIFPKSVAYTIESLILTGNILQFAEIGYLKNIRIIRLENNKMKSFSMRYNYNAVILELFIINNEFICDCNGQDYINWYKEFISSSNNNTQIKYYNIFQSNQVCCKYPESMKNELLIAQKDMMPCTMKNGNCHFELGYVVYCTNVLYSILIHFMSTNFNITYNHTQLHVQDVSVYVLDRFTAFYVCGYKEILFKQDKISNISKGVFNCAHNLEVLDLQDNHLKKIFCYNLLHNKKLRILNLKNNHITFVEDCAFENNIQLIHLDLSYNFIKVLDKILFANLNSLTRLFLNNNRIVSIMELNFPPSLLFLTVNYNEMKDLPPITSQRFKNLNLKENEFVCRDELIKQISEIVTTFKETLTESVLNTYVNYEKAGVTLEYYYETYTRYEECELTCAINGANLTFNIFLESFQNTSFHCTEKELEINSGMLSTIPYISPLYNYTTQETNVYNKIYTTYNNNLNKGSKSKETISILKKPIIWISLMIIFIIIMVIIAIIIFKQYQSTSLVAESYWWKFFDYSPQFNYESNNYVPNNNANEPSKIKNDEANNSDLALNNSFNQDTEPPKKGFVSPYKKKKNSDYSDMGESFSDFSQT